MGHLAIDDKILQCIPRKCNAEHLRLSCYLHTDKYEEFITTNCENTAYEILKHLVGKDWKHKVHRLVDWSHGMRPRSDEIWLVDLGTEHFLVATSTAIFESRAFKHTVRMRKLNDDVVASWNEASDLSITSFLLQENDAVNQDRPVRN